MKKPHDPTRSGAPVPDSAARLSRSEIQALCLKAARGAGLLWGLAEEAGMAARRLAESGLPGPEWLLAYLEGPRGGAPVIRADNWRAATGALCPLAAGAALGDRSEQMSVSTLGLSDVEHPGLLLPFFTLSGAERVWRMDWTGGHATAGPGGIAVFGVMPARADVTLTARAVPTPPAAPVSIGGRIIPLAVWHRLDALALATTVPPSASSRTGAGAGNTDND